MRAKVLNIKLFALNKPSAILKVKYFKIPHYADTNRYMQLSLVSTPISSSG